MTETSEGNGTYAELINTNQTLPRLVCNDGELFDQDDPITASVLSAIVAFREIYSPWHRWVSLVLCICGLLANAVHIRVLTHSRMRGNSVHTVLTAIACADIGTMITYLIYVLRFEFAAQPIGYTYLWIVFLKIHVVLSVVLHAISLYLVVMMALIRYTAMTCPHNNPWMNPNVAMVRSVLVAVAGFVLVLPTYLSHQIYESCSNVPGEGCISSIGFSQMVQDNNCLLLKANLWLTGLLLKVVPCLLLFVFTILLVGKLRMNSKKREQLLSRGSSNSKTSTTRSGKRDLTTYMLLLMVTVFLIAELPQGIISIFNALYTSQFHRLVYHNVGDALDLLSLINCYVGFLVFVCTCSRYRDTLLQVLPSRCATGIQTLLRHRWLSLRRSMPGTGDQQKRSTMMMSSGTAVQNGLSASVKHTIVHDDNNNNGDAGDTLL